MRSKWLSLSALVLALGLVTAACSSNKTPSGGSPSSSASASASPSASSSGATGTITINGDVANNHGVKEVSKQADVGVNSFYFDPTIIKAAPGSKVTLKLTNVSDTLHNFSLTQQSVDQDIPSKGNLLARSPFQKSRVGGASAPRRYPCARNQPT